MHAPAVAGWAPAAAGGRTPGSQHAPAVAFVCASRDAGEATWQQGRRGCSRSELAGA